MEIDFDKLEKSLNMFEEYGMDLDSVNEESKLHAIQLILKNKNKDKK